MLEFARRAVLGKMLEKSKKNKSPAEGAYRFGEFHLYPSERTLKARRSRHLTLPQGLRRASALRVKRRASRAPGRAHRHTLARHLRHRRKPHQRHRQVCGRCLAAMPSRRFRNSVTGSACPFLENPASISRCMRRFSRGKSWRRCARWNRWRVRAISSRCAWPGIRSLHLRGPGWDGAIGFSSSSVRGPSANMDLQTRGQSALAIDPDLACAHHFYTHLQVDLGQSQDVIVRLARRIAARGGEPESFAGLVQGLRSCGLLGESLLAHKRATALDPAIVTSVPHTHFLLCEYEVDLKLRRHTLLPRRGVLDCAGRLGTRYEVTCRAPSQAAGIRLLGFDVGTDGLASGHPRKEAQQRHDDHDRHAD